MITPLNPNPIVNMFDMNTVPTHMSVPLRQCLVMSLLYGDSHQLYAALFASNLVCQVVVGVTGECPEKILYSPTVHILLVFRPKADINRVKVQLECQASWMGKAIHLNCVRPSGKDLRQFGVMGSIGPSPTPGISNHQGKEGDAALQLPFFSGNHPPGKDEVSFHQWLSAVERAQFTSSSSALYCWISRSVREPAAQVLRNVSVGASIDTIMSSFKLKYGAVVTFDELMKRFWSVYQFPVESVTDYAVRLEKAFAEIRDNYPKQLGMVDKTQHLRERFYQGLRRRIHQKLTPWYEDGKIFYMVLLKKARELEAEDCPPTTATSKGARDDP